MALRAVTAVVLLLHPPAEIAPRDGVTKAAVERAGAAAAFYSVDDGFNFAAHFVEGQRP
jgi:hypothetical protein